MFDVGTPAPNAAPLAEPFKIVGLDLWSTPHAPEAAKTASINFGDYCLEQQIAHGGMGVVYRARQISLDRLVAVKLLLLGRYSSADSIERFRREARSAAALRHPNIVAIYEVGEHDAQSFLAMEFVEGKNLAELLRAGPLSAARAAEYARSLAEAIHYAHVQGVLHRDLKPSNVLIDDRDEVRVTDFGLAKKLDGSSDLTFTGQLFGTPNYLSPEAAAGRNGEVGPATDIYAIGALLYELLTGRPPFLAQSLQETLLRIRDIEPVAPRALNASVPRDLETIALKCLEKSPIRRYASAQALARDLGAWLRREPIEARPITKIERGWKWARRNPRASVLLGITVLAVTGFIVSLTLFSLRLARANRITQQANTQLSANLRDLEWQKAEDLEWTGKTSSALATFGRFLRENPRDQAAASRILSLLSLRNFALPASEQLVHGEPVVRAELSPDGRRVLTASIDGTARVWDSVTSRQLVEVRARAPLTNAGFLGDGDRFVTLQANVCQIWDAESGQLLTAFTRSSQTEKMLAVRSDRSAFAFEDGNSIRVVDARSLRPVGPAVPLAGHLWSAEFSSDGRHLLTCTFTESHQGDVSVWDVVSGVRLLGPLRGKRTTVAFSPDGSKIGLASTDGVLSVIDARTGDELARNGFIGKDPVLLKISSDGRRIVTALWSSSVQIWDFTTLRPIGPALEEDSHGCVIDLSSDSRHLVTGSRQGLLRLWDLNNSQVVGESFEHDGPISSVKFSADGTQVVTASEDATARILDLRMHAPTPVTLDLHADVRAVEFSSDGRRLLTASSQGAQLWDARALHPIGKPMSHEALFGSGLSRNGALLFTSSFFGTVRLWDAQTGEPFGEPLVHSADVWQSVFSSDSRLLITTSRDAHARVWDTSTGQLMFPALAHPAEVHVVSVSPDDERFVTGCLDGVARLWSLRTGAPIGQPMRHRGLIWHLNFSSDGTRIVSGAGDATAQIWDGRTGAPIGNPMRHDKAVFWVEFSPDGTLVLTASDDGTARVWDGRTGQPISRWMHHRARIWMAHFSPDGRLIATASDDGTARLWDARSGFSVSEPLRHLEKAERVSFSPDGTRLATGSTDGNVGLWDVRLAPVPAPAWFIDLAEAVAGRRIGKRSEITRVPQATLRTLRDRLSNSTETDFYSRWGRWFFQERLKDNPAAFEP